MKTSKRLHIATSREIGEQCKQWAKENGYILTGIDECDIFISVMYDKIIPVEYIASRPCYNFHPGVLPWYRGAGAYSWAIINGEFETGVTLHEIDEDIDHGDVITIERFEINEKDTAETLFKKAEDRILLMFQIWIDNLIIKNYETIKQGVGHTYYRKDLEKIRDLTKFARAFTFNGKPNAFYIDEMGAKNEIRYE